VETENTAETIKLLQGCISDLISVVALPAVWKGKEPSQIITTVLDGLVGMLRLDFIYARISNASPSEVLRLAESQTPLIPPGVVGQALKFWMMDSSFTSPVTIPNPIGPGKVSLALFRLGSQDEVGVVVAASHRSDFPTKIETLLLRVAANQAAIGLQEAHLLTEQKRAAEQFEQKVKERTTQLGAVNEELIREITERERAQEEQRELAALVANSTDFIGVASLEGPALFLNPAGQRMIGLEGEKEVRATTMSSYFAPLELDRFRNEVLPAVMRDGRWEGEISLRHFKTGAMIPMLHHLFFIKEPGTDRRLALATISRDMTARKRAEKTLLNSELALQLAHTELAHASRVLTVGELTASIAHEVNQPLGAIVTNGNASLRLIARDKPDLEGAREAVECMIADALRASEVIKRIRALLKKSAPEMAPLNVNWTIQEVLELTARELAKNEIVLTTELGADLCPVLGDRVQLQQVLLNLILNSSEAMSAPDWQPRELLVTSRMSDSAQLMVAVSDTGNGLDPKTAEHIFNPFVSTKEGGLGLGLSISRTIVEAHGGRLWATRNSAQGTTFQFTLPAGDNSPPSAGQS
jgi:PAS domain S-box-containing protein